ncbi:hypothetical protein KAS08_05175 [Candidatus Pacearchaeota archaeon]|nr:hypothetical protein [Candidatus Pacearchaeota archaeon]
MNMCSCIRDEKPQSFGLAYKVFHGKTKEGIVKESSDFGHLYYESKRFLDEVYTQIKKKTIL